MNSHGYIASDFTSQSSSLFLIHKKREKEVRLETLPPEIKYSILLHDHIKSHAPKVHIINDYLASGAMIDYQDINGYNVLMIAAETQNENITKYLLTRKANPGMRNNEGELASDLISSSSPVFEFLKEKEKMALLEKLPREERFGSFLLEHLYTPEVRTRRINEYLHLGANINYQNINGYTPLMIAVDTQNDRIAEYLLRRGADPFIQNINNETVRDLVASNGDLYQIIRGYELLFATRNGNPSVPKIKNLLNEDPCLIDFKDHRGYTALLMAIELNLEFIVEYLVLSGANLNITNNKGEGVFDLATNEGIKALITSDTAFFPDESQNIDDTYINNHLEGTVDTFSFFTSSNDSSKGAGNKKMNPYSVC